MTVAEMMQKRAGLLTRCQEILSAADTAKRALSAEERSNYDAAFAEATQLKEDADRKVQLERAAIDAAETDRRNNEGGQTNDQRSVAQRDAFERFVRSGEVPQQRDLLQSQGSQGGVLVPEMLSTQIIKAVDNLLFVRRLATTMQLTGAQSLGVPSMDNDVSDAEWTGEVSTVSTDTTMSFGKRELRPHLVAKQLKVSNTLRRNLPNILAFLTERLAYKIAVPQENAFLTGDGVGKPLGVFTASADGIPTSRDVSSGNAATSVKFDGLIAAKMALKEQYQMAAQWAFHRDVVAQIAKLKDGEGRYLWQASLVAGRPDTILNLPVNMTEYAPNTMTSGQYVGIVGDWSHYWIADALSMEIQILNELHALTNQAGIIIRAETDGMPVLGEAFARVKLG